MDDRKVETGDEWENFAESVKEMAREEGLLGIIIAGFYDAGGGAMGMNLSMLNAPSLCDHDKMGMRLKTIEKLALTTFNKLHDEVHAHDESDDGEHGELQ